MFVWQMLCSQHRVCGPSVLLLQYIHALFCTVEPRTRLRTPGVISSLLKREWSIIFNQLVMLSSAQPQVLLVFCARSTNGWLVSNVVSIRTTYVCPCLTSWLPSGEPPAHPGGWVYFFWGAGFGICLAELHGFVVRPFLQRAEAPWMTAHPSCGAPAALPILHCVQTCWGCSLPCHAGH